MDGVSRRHVSRWIAGALLVMAVLAAVLPVTRVPAASIDGHGHADGRVVLPVEGPLQSSGGRVPAPFVPRRKDRSRALTSHLNQVTGTVQSSAQMALPASAFPADFALMKSTSVTPADLDNFYSTQLHTRSYSDLGALGGWYQYYSKDLGDGLFDDVYVGTFYPSAEVARAAFTDVQQNLDAHGVGASCSLGEQCYQATIGILFPDGEYRAIFRVVQSSNGLAEMLANVPAADFVTLRGTQAADLDLLTSAFLRIAEVPAATAAPTVTPSPMPTATLPPTATPAPTATNTPSPTATATATPIPPPSHLTVKVSGMPHAEHTGTVRVQVLSSDSGQPVAGVQVSVDGRAVGIRSVGHASTNGQGRATFSGFHPLHSGRVTVRATRSGFVTKTVHVAVRS